MKKWELARYIIDAKKCVDSLYFIYDNLKHLCNLNIRNIVKERTIVFYLNICFVLDDCFKNKKDLCSKDKIVKNVYYNRDKNIAHKDYNYTEEDFDSIEKMADDFKMIITHICEITKKFIPDVLTLDFIRYDRDLFRYINKISPDEEEKIKKKKYPFYGNNDSLNNEDTMTINILHDIDDLKKINDTSKYGVLLDAGLNSYEHLQNMQDGCIKINVLYGENMWMHINHDNDSFKRVELLKKYDFIDKYDLLNIDKIISNEILYKKILDGDVDE